MGVSWNDFPKDLRSKLESSFVKKAERVAERFDTMGVLNLLKACGSLRYRWYEHQSIREAVFGSFYATFPRKTETKTREICAYVSNFGKSGIQWSDLPAEAREIILRESLHHSSSFYAGQLNRLLEG
jgi:hypothetical protein